MERTCEHGQRFYCIDCRNEGYPTPHLGTNDPGLREEGSNVMGMRFTRRDAEMSFRQLVAVMGGETTDRGEIGNNVGKYLLDHAAGYGGFRIERIDNEHGGVETPFGNTRRNAREFCGAVWFAIDAIRETERNDRAKHAVE